MKNLPIHHSRAATRALPLLAAIAVIGMAGAAKAAVVINATFALNAGIYTYSYSVTNTGSPADLTVIDIPIGEGVAVANLTSPTGFGIISDGAPVNAVTFFEDNDFFTPQTFGEDSTVEFFTYQSASGPMEVMFTAQDANGDTFTGRTLSAVPEPSGLLLLAASLIPLIAARRRGRC